MNELDLQGMKERHHADPEIGWDDRCVNCEDPWPCDFERLRIAYEERGKALDGAEDRIWNDVLGNAQRKVGAVAWRDAIKREFDRLRALNPNPESEEVIPADAERK